PGPRAAGPGPAACGGGARCARCARRRRRRRALVGRPPLRVRGCLRRVGPYHRPSGHRMIETTLERGVGLRIRPWLGIAAAASFVVASFMALIWAPADAVQGEVYRIIYVHVPSAWLAYLAFVVVFLASVGWLWSRRPLFDAIAVASAELGVLFTGLGLGRCVHPRVRLLHLRPGRDRARASGAAVDPNVGFIAAAFAIVWGALLAYLVSLRARSA